MAVHIDTGELVWQTPNPSGWNMTHSSIMPMDMGGVRHYIYCAQKGVVGVSALDGSLLWQTEDWKISIATVPSPCVVSDDRVFLSGGYNAGSLMLRLEGTGQQINPTPVFRLDADTFGATQQTPILHQGHLYGIRPDGRFVCLSLDGSVVWTSDPSDTFGLGPYMVAGDVIYAMDDHGLLSAIRARPDRYEKLSEVQVLEGRESWGPMALAGNRLLVRDLTRMACFDLATP
jgi:outer membrane protein assembly factor BamB